MTAPRALAAKATPGRITALVQGTAWLGLLLVACAAQAQVEAIDAPITASASPEVGLPGVRITLEGETPPANPGAKVTVRIDPPGDEVETFEREVEISDGGRWELVLKDDDTALLGRYDVQVTAPDGKGQAEAPFDIVDGDAYEELVESLHREMNESLDETEKVLVARIRDIAGSLPDPGPDGGGKEGLDDRIDKFVDIFDRARTARPPVIPLPKPPGPPTPPEPGQPPTAATPPAPVDDEMYAVPIETYESVIEESLRVRTAVQQSERMSDVCAKMEALGEAVNFASTLMNFVGKAGAVFQAHLTDKVSPAVIESTNKSTSTEAGRFATAESIKVYAASMERWKGVVAAVPGLGLDVIGFVNKIYFDKWCTKFEGPFTGKLNIQFFTDGQQRLPYWTYTVEIGGILHLTQPRAMNDKPGSLMTGRFDGAAIGYVVTEDVMRLQPKLRSMLVFNHLIVPPKNILLPPPEMGSVFNGHVSPFGFQIPVTAVRKGDGVIVNFAASAITDMSPKVNRGLLIQVFQAGPIPAPNYQTLPMQDAYFILTRGMRKDALLVQTQAGGIRKLANTFHRTEDTGDILLNWDVQAEICAPGCTETSIDRMKAYYKAWLASLKKK